MRRNMPRQPASPANGMAAAAWAASVGPADARASSRRAASGRPASSSLEPARLRYRHLAKHLQKSDEGAVPLTEADWRPAAASSRQLHRECGVPRRHCECRSRRAIQSPVSRSSATGPCRSRRHPAGAGLRGPSTSPVLSALHDRSLEANPLVHLDPVNQVEQKPARSSPLRERGGMRSHSEQGRSNVCSAGSGCSC